jgi:hypothetical protein
MANPSPTAPRPADKQDVTSPAKPVAAFQYGRVSAAIFADDVKMPSGTIVSLHNVSLRRSYRTAQGEWENTHSLRRGDLLPAAYALTKCYEYLGSADGTDEDERQ